jgi:hypothetical protein
MWGLSQNKNVLAAYPELRQNVPSGFNFAPQGSDPLLATGLLLVAGSGGVQLTFGAAATTTNPLVLTVLTVAAGAYASFQAGRGIASIIQGILRAAEADASAGDDGVVTPGVLTQEEFDELQKVADKWGIEIKVHGSRARGEGRNIDTNLPVGKGEGTKSDVDVRVDGQAVIDSGGRLADDLKNIGGGKLIDLNAPILPGQPVIVIRPRKK